MFLQFVKRIITLMNSIVIQNCGPWPCIEVDIHNTLEGALFESTGNTILWALCSMLEADRSKKGGNGLK